MEFKEILSYTKKWWWLVLVLALLGSFGSYWLYDKLPNQRTATTWSARARFETPRDSLRVVSMGEKNTLRVRVDINSEKFAIHSDANRDTAAHYFALIDQEPNFTADKGAEVLESKEYREFLKKLEQIAGEPLPKGQSYYNVNVLSDTLSDSQRMVKPFAKESLQEGLATAKERVKALRISADSISNTRVVEITVAGAKSQREARIWADAMVLASVRESFRRHIDNFRAQIARERKLYDAKREQLSEEEASALEAMAAKRLEIQEKVTPLDGEVTSAEIQAQGLNPPGKPRFYQTNQDVRRKVYYSALKSLINTRSVDAEGSKGRNYTKLVSDIRLGRQWDQELSSQINSLKNRIRRLRDTKLSPASKLNGEIPFEEGLVEKARSEFNALIESGDKAALEAYRPNPAVIASGEVNASRRKLHNINQRLEERLQKYTLADYGVTQIQREKAMELANWERVIAEAIETKAAILKTQRVSAESIVQKIDEELAERRIALGGYERALNRNKDVAILYNEARLELDAAEERGLLDTQRINGYEAGLNEQTAVLRAEAFSSNARELRARDNRWQVSVIVGLIILVGSSVMIYVMMLARNKIANEYDVRKHVNLPVLAKMGKRPEGEGSLLTISPRSAAAEAYSTLATQIRSYARELSLRSVLVTSAVKSEGKTDVTCNLSIALARKGLSVLVVDSDLHRPRVANFFGVTATTGMMQYAQMPEDADVIEYVMPTFAGGPDLLLPGGEIQDPVRLLESEAFKAMLKQAEREYDIVLFDSAPVARVGDALIVGSETDATLMVCCAGEVSFADAALAKRLLTNIQANLLGVVLNNAQDVSAKEYYNYYSYGDHTRRSVRKVFD